jgi:hypothetical protein
MDNAGKRGGGEERQRVRKKLEKKSHPPLSLPLPSNKLAFCNQTFVQRPPPLFRSTDDDDDDKDVDDVDTDDPVSSPFAKMVKRTAEEAKMLVCRGEVELR